jgi:hypothetical protein
MTAISEDLCPALSVLDRSSLGYDMNTASRAGLAA